MKTGIQEIESLAPRVGELAVHLFLRVISRRPGSRRKVLEQYASGFFQHPDKLDSLVEH